MPVNPDVQVAIGGVSYTLRFSARALAAMQDHWELPNLDAVGEKLTSLDTGSVSLDDYTAILWAALRTHHRDVTFDGALDLLDDLGIEGFMDALGKVMAASSAEGGGDATANPPRGRSTGSSNSGAKSASRRR